MPDWTRCTHLELGSTRARARLQSKGRGLKSCQQGVERRQRSMESCCTSQLPWALPLDPPIRSQGACKASKRARGEQQGQSRLQPAVWAVQSCPHTQCDKDSQGFGPISSAGRPTSWGRRARSVGRNEGWPGVEDHEANSFSVLQRSSTTWLRPLHPHPCLIFLFRPPSPNPGAPGKTNKAQLGQCPPEEPAKLEQPRGLPPWSELLPAGTGPSKQVPVWPCTCIHGTYMPLQTRWEETPTSVKPPPTSGLKRTKHAR